MTMKWVCNGATQASSVNILVQRLGNAQGGGGLLTSIASNVANANQYTWQIPANLTAGTYMVFVEDTENPVISNSSLVSNPTRCQPFSAYNPELLAVYQRLDWMGLRYLVSSATSLGSMAALLLSVAAAWSIA